MWVMLPVTENRQISFYIKETTNDDIDKWVWFVDFIKSVIYDSSMNTIIRKIYSFKIQVYYE